MVTQRKLLIGMAATSALLAGCGSLGATGSSSDSIVFGVSAPLTGNNAEYGKIWQKGFGLALDEINGAGVYMDARLSLSMRTRNDESTEADLYG
ncbi:hypothetical protein KSF_072730 [Reticulibacter mediterranei]|uniref:ABC transporter substrate-binding protein n=1 Tax=Reticulibacter mediterranei TaxID=2778369 RepID=A0A8J3N6A8_9CHLR|nr:hypothetical protein [Reticulibacter mediterranei]GHO97225.1 hypothetical protein KSF_072730 [Reticulibacter mediterranei]